MIHLLGLLKNPLFRMIGSKTVGMITHKLEKDKIIKGKEIEAAKSISIAQINAGQSSWKDEWLCLFFTIIFGLHFIPYFQNTMERGWEILKSADPMFFYIILTIVGASFGVTTMIKFKKK